MKYGCSYKIGDIIEMNKLALKPHISGKVAIIMEQALINDFYDYHIVVCGMPNKKFRIYERDILRKV